jgi:hypothetical protein
MAGLAFTFGRRVDDAQRCVLVLVEQQAVDARRVEVERAGQVLAQVAVD